MHRFTIKTVYNNDEKEDPYVKLYPSDSQYRFDEIIHEIGFGKYQYKILGVIALMNTSIGVFMTLISFLIPLYKKDILIDKWEVGLLVASQGLGSLIGGLFFGYLSDLYGRKCSLVSALFITSAASIISVMFGVFWPFLFARFIAAIGYGGLMPVGVTYLTEYLPDNSRGFYLIGMDLFRNFGGVLCIAVASYSNDDWRFFVLAPVPMFMLTMIVMFIIMPESNRYLLFKNNITKLMSNLNNMAKQNGNDFEVIYHQSEKLEAKRASRKKKETSICNDLIIKKAGTTIPLAFVWFFPAFGTGVFVFLPEIMLIKGFSMTEIYILSGVLLFLPMFGVVGASVFIDKFSRKQLIMFCALIAGGSLCSYIFIPDGGKKIITYYVILGTFAIFMKMLKSITSAYTPELYSTSTRTTAMGFMSGIDRFAGILQPMIFTNLIYASTQLAMIGFGACYLLGFLFSMFLTRETANRPLKDSYLSSLTESYMDNSQMGYSMMSEHHKDD